MTKESTALNEDSARLGADAAHLREWLAKQPHIRGRTDDEFLLRFIRGCKHSLERVKEKIDTFYTMRTALPEFFKNRDTMDPIVQDILRKGVLLPLSRVANGHRFILMRPGLFDPAVPANYLTRAHSMLIELMMEEDGERIGQGHGALLDFKGVTMAHLVHFTPAFCKKTIQVYQESFPIRPKSVHYVNILPILDTTLAVLKSVFKEKIRKRIVVHKNLESVHKAIPKDILPREYGGYAGTAEEIAEHWRQKMIDKRAFFLEDEQYKVDESKRPGKSKTHEDLFGFEGSFRQLNVD